jgi:hypothetical protein
MLTDTTLRNLKPQSAPYKVSDRDGLYVMVTTTGCISFRYDYRLNGRRETFVIGRYSSRGLTLALARAACSGSLCEHPTMSADAANPSTVAVASRECCMTISDA